MFWVLHSRPVTSTSPPIAFALANPTHVAYPSPHARKQTKRGARPGRPGRPVVSIRVRRFRSAVVAFCGRRVRRRSDLRWSLSSRSAVVVGRLPASSQPRRLSTTAAPPATERPNVRTSRSRRTDSPRTTLARRLAMTMATSSMMSINVTSSSIDSASLGLRCTGTPRLRDTTPTASPTGDRVVEGLRHGVEGADPRWNSWDAASVASSSSSRDT